MPNFIRKSLIGIALLSMGAEVQAQDDVDCKQCVDTKDIAPQAVTTGKIKKQAVTTNKLAPQAVTTAKIKNGAVTIGKVGPKLKNAIGTFCEPGQVVIGKDSSGNFVCEPPGGIAATCDEPQVSSSPRLRYNRNLAGAAQFGSF